MNPFKLCVRFVMVDSFMLQNQWAPLMAQLVKNPPALEETWVQSLGWEDLLEEGMETHSSILDLRIPGQRGLVCDTPRGGKESDTTE